MNKYFIVLVAMVSLFLLACTPEDIPPQFLTEEDLAYNETQLEADKVVVKNQQSPSELELMAEQMESTCSVNTDCVEGKQCIGGSCSTVAELYTTEGCDSMCNYNNVKIATNDGESYALSRGQGSYSYAGAISWKVLTGPDYCQGESTVVPIEIEKKNTGEIVSAEVIVLKVGETSAIIKHPDIARVAFAITLDSIDETCS
jgi:hypothetical protein